MVSGYSAYKEKLFHSATSKYWLRQMILVDANNVLVEVTNLLVEANIL